jgi:hypothetical protein
MIRGFRLQPPFSQSKPLPGRGIHGWTLGSGTCSNPDSTGLRGRRDPRNSTKVVFSVFSSVVWWLYLRDSGRTPRFDCPAKANEAICTGGELGFSLETSGGEWFDHQDRRWWPCLVSPPFNRLAIHQIRSHGNGSAPSVYRARISPCDCVPIVYEINAMILISGTLAKSICNMSHGRW